MCTQKPKKSSSRRHFMKVLATIFGGTSLSSAASAGQFFNTRSYPNHPEGVYLLWLPFASHCHLGFVSLEDLKDINSDTTILTSKTLDMDLIVGEDRKIILPIAEDFEKVDKHIVQIENKSKEVYVSKKFPVKNVTNITAEKQGLSKNLNIVAELAHDLLSKLEAIGWGAQSLIKNRFVRAFNACLNHKSFRNHRHAMVISPNMKKAIIEEICLDFKGQRLLEVTSCVGDQRHRRFTDQSLTKYCPIHWTALGHDVYIIHSQTKIHELIKNHKTRVSKDIPSVWNSFLDNFAMPTNGMTANALRNFWFQEAFKSIAEQDPKVYQTYPHLGHPSLENEIFEDPNPPFAWFTRR